MKNMFFALTAGTLLSLTTFAQKENAGFKPFKADLSLGYAIPSGTGAKGGVLFAFEPKYAVIPNVAVGLRLEGTVVARFAGYDADGQAIAASVKFSSSYLATGDYYLTNSYNFRPFVGAGAGMFLIAGVETNQSSGTVSTGTKFGGMLRAGMEISHFRVGLEYNLVPKTTYVGYDQDGNLVSGLSSKNSYIGIKIGAVFGGGPRR
jgi:hypothetical protein